MMNWEWCWRKWSWHISRHYSSICQGGVWKTLNPLTNTCLCAEFRSRYSPNTKQKY